MVLPPPQTRRIGREAEGRRQETEGRRQETEGRRQETEGRRSPRGITRRQKAESPPSPPRGGDRRQGGSATLALIFSYRHC